MVGQCERGSSHSSRGGSHYNVRKELQTGRYELEVGCQSFHYWVLQPGPQSETQSRSRLIRHSDLDVSIHYIFIFCTKIIFKKNEK